MRRLCFLFALCACKGIVLGEPSSPVDDEALPRPSNEADSVFDDAVIHQIDLTLSDASFQTLIDDEEAEVPGDLVFDGEPVSDVGVRLRGGLGSFRPITEKPKLGFDFNEFVDGGRFRGLKKLYLNSAVQDCSYLKEVTSHHAFLTAGVPASRTGFTKLTVNGEDYGLYILIEPHDDKFIEARYTTPGNLYDGKYLHGGRTWWPVTRLDLDQGRDDFFELEEGTDVDHADVKAASDAIHDTKRKNLLAETSDLIDWGEILRMFAVEMWIGQGDGYTSFRNNFRLYFDGSDGRLELFPYDMDATFTRDNLKGAAGKLAKYCWRQPECASAQLAAIEQVVSRIDTEEFLAWYDGVAALTLEAAQSDPKNKCDAGKLESVRQNVRDWITTRNEIFPVTWGRDDD